MKLPIDDSLEENIEKYFEQAFIFIKEGIQQGGCLVHW